jgi:hypothetical protein
MGLYERDVPVVDGVTIGATSGMPGHVIKFLAGE